MIRSTAHPISASNDTQVRSPVAPVQAKRIRSQDLFQQAREVEIEHDGRIYRMRLTQLNKLILTA
jgi:hemin uptake protein HemP